MDSGSLAKTPKRSVTNMIFFSLQKHNRLIRAALKAILALLLLLLVALAVAAVLTWRPPRTDNQQELFQGVTYSRQARLTPRPLMIHVIRIDLSAPGINFLVTPGDLASSMDLFAATTTEFLKKYDLQVAINGGFFKPFRTKDHTLNDYYPHSGDPVDVRGLAISNSRTYSADDVPYPKLCIAGNHVQICRTTCSPDTTQAIAGNPIIVENGELATHDPNPPLDRINPRTAVALDAEKKTFWLVVIDGRQEGYSEGVTLDELADILVGLGAESALNLDGGGSSTLAVAGWWGARVLNAPYHTRIRMRQRPVANHLGVYALALK